MLSFVAVAQSAPKLTAEKAAEQNALVIKEKYGLTDAQYSGIYQAELEYQKQVFQLKEAGGEPGDGQAMQMELGREQGFQRTMTSDQFARYKADIRSAR